MGQKKRRILYAAFDESYGNGHSKEIIAVVFSTIPKDIKRESFDPKGRDYERVKKRLQHPQRDCRFTVIESEKKKKNDGKPLIKKPGSLPLVAPYLINNFLETYPSLEDLQKLRLLFDGVFPDKWIDMLKEDFGRRVELEISRHNGQHKLRDYPLLLRDADVMANFYLREERDRLPNGEIYSHSKYIPVDKGDLEERLKHPLLI